MDSGRSDPRPLTAEEEAIKLNTDCVYFLASPLTCKKGSECEYRHSEDARINPRDCKFWLSGKCLNPKCFFRHPPLDGMIVSPRTTSAKTAAFSHVPPSMPLPMAKFFTYNFGRNNVPCYYYLKGACLKGDKCPFMHGPPSAANPVAKQNVKISAQIAMQLETSEKDAAKITERKNQQNLPAALNIGAEKLANGSPSLREGGRAVESTPGSRNGLARSQTTYDPVRSSSSYSSSQNLHVQPDRQRTEAGEMFMESSEVGYAELESPLNHQLQSPLRHHHDAQAAEEVFRDSSPGFDVLVDHVVRDTDYFYEQDCFRGVVTEGKRNVNREEDYDHYLSDYESSTRLDRFRHDRAGDFHYGIEQNGDDWDQQMISSAFERLSDRPLYTERGSSRRLRSPDEMDASDLRHRLRKQRRQNGYFSATSSVHYNEPYGKHDRNMRDGYHAHNSYKKKDNPLHGSAINTRLRGRITLPKQPCPEIRSDLPVRPSGKYRSLGQRLGWRPTAESFANPRYFGRQQKSRDAVDLLDFIGPRRLEELKGAKADRNSQGHSRLRDSEASVEFEGPKPLSILLKRKRESLSENHAISGGCNDRVTAEDEQINYEQKDAGDETVARDAMEDGEEPDYSDQKDGEYYCATVEGGDSKREDDYVGGLDADLDPEEDEDDFAKKIGLIFT
ncbi:zinc finger CCCH domain-containing protein 32-like [Phalaenopsis equestris]|uniref:zinc finger CCCH domain-containing protein 32-like n=1 Tax=Phalaenopsis equestris TaxID=78828 RepID=UPI0009E63B5E|nr:zinc finger CCCH domain-containing protein 32-like [Phalaenopsis equestris]